ncbi:hypothetical protein C7Y71_008545 [Pseudoprevotella muciniphila]|uniref:Right-handed parallel beta-helix repeat-containing protein n=1 Tax=Pseudoprevotella muciniphila TaxID=2133944 RepID=A0A5P8E7R2_9BACT|nr:hypothetical protein [Pseudoprevotella muciniphila]QFQ13065.1 hypothetical protein C7Y71_008545 [Pseudoprevotella muciniphila]
MTEQEKQELKQEIIAQIQSESQDVTELARVQTLDGINTLPALRGTELVIVPVSLLGSPARTAATAAMAAKELAETAAATAGTAAENANEKAGLAQTAASQATEVLEAMERSHCRRIYRYFADDVFTETGLMRADGSVSTSSAYLHTVPMSVAGVERFMLHVKLVADTATSFFPIVVWLDDDNNVVGYVNCTAGEVDYELVPPLGATLAVFNALRTFVVQTDKIVCHADIVSATPFAHRIYLSPEGSDENDGLSKGNPVQTLRRANTLLAPDGELVMLAGDYYNLPLDLSNYGRLTGSGRVRIISCYRVTAATAMSGYTRVMSATIDNPPVRGTYLWQHDVADAATAIAPDEVHPVQEGATHRLPSTRIYPAASIAEIEESADVLKWYVSGTTLYFSIAAGTDLATHPVVIPRRTVAASEGGSIEVRNVRFLYSGLLLGGMHGMLENVSVGMTNAAGAVRYDGTTDFLMRRCEAFGCSNDGFNGHGTSAAPSDIVLEDCWAHDNSDDGESCHEHCAVTSRGGLYEYNGNGCTPASGGRASYYGVTARKNLPGHAWTGSTREGTGFSAQGAATSGAQTAMLCQGCHATGNSTGIRTTLTTGTIAVECTSVDNAADYGGNVVIVENVYSTLQRQKTRYAAHGADYDTLTGTWRMHKVGNDYLVTGLSAADMEVICAGVDINGAGSLFGALGSPYAGKTNRRIYTYTGIHSKFFPLIANSMANGNKSLEVFYSPYHASGLLCVSNLSAGFANCSALRVVKYLDVSRVTNYAGFGNAFLNCGNLEECYLKGFDAQKDIRTGHETDGTLDFSKSPKLTRESLVFIVENAGTAYEKNLRIPSGIYTAWNADEEASPTWQEFTEMCVSKKISIHLA